MKHIVKRNKTYQTYDSRKLYASIYSSCLSVLEPTTVAEEIAERVTIEVEGWLNNKSEITSNDIRRAAGKVLKQINPHAGYVYMHHRVIL